jgi:hypothetical protein
LSQKKIDEIAKPTEEALRVRKPVKVVNLVPALKEVKLLFIAVYLSEEKDTKTKKIIIK